jgi:hypothetical protein
MAVIPLPFVVALRAVARSSRSTTFPAPCFGNADECVCPLRFEAAAPPAYEAADFVRVDSYPLPRLSEADARTSTRHDDLRYGETSQGLLLRHLLGDEAGVPFMPYRNVN